VTAYCAAKGAVAALTRAVAVHCRQRGDPIRRKAILPTARLALYLASDGSRLMSGQSRVLDETATITCFPV